MPPDITNFIVSPANWLDYIGLHVHSVQETTIDNTVGRALHHNIAFLLIEYDS